MDKRCVDLHIPAANGGVSIISFCLLATAVAYAAEIGATSYKITCGAHVLRRVRT